MSDTPIRRFLPTRGATANEAPGEYRWEAVDLLAYRADEGSSYRDVTRQTLFRREDLAGELRYFEVASGGHSTLERHGHVHAVVVLRGRGRCLVGDRVHAIREFDLVTVPSRAWHQFRASAEAPLGFLCLVDARRDRPERPDAGALAALRADPRIAAFLDGR